MTGVLGSLTFMAPLALVALGVLPVIWWLLRFTPPRPVHIAFPPVRLLLELVNQRMTPDKTPWWLLLLRLAIAAIVILGVSHPFLKPAATSQGDAPLLLVMDDGWAAAQDWGQRRQIANEMIDDAERAGQPVALTTTTARAQPYAVDLHSANDARKQLAALEPQALATNRLALLKRLNETFRSSGKLHVIWLADGLGQSEASTFSAGLAQLAGGTAEVEAYLPALEQLPAALAPLEFSGGQIVVRALRASAASPGSTEAVALAGNGRELARLKLDFAGNNLQASAKLDLPVELRNTAERIALQGQHNAAANVLMDDLWRRKTVALLTGQSLADAQPLLSPLYYVSRALEPYAELSQPSSPEQLKQQLDSGLSMLVLADYNILSSADHDNVVAWLERGSVLVRFAGPRMAGSQDDLLPVTLREGGRELGSTMSWEAPQPLSLFTAGSPFADLKPDVRVSVTRQVLADPEPDLSAKVWASLSDGTPLVTAAPRGKGLIVLFHVTATPDWSSLPISGQFVDMLRHILERAPTAGAGMAADTKTAFANEGTFRPRLTLSADGELTNPPADIAPLTLQQLQAAKASPETPAGIYARGQTERAINATANTEQMAAITNLPSPVALKDMQPQPRRDLAPLLFISALMLFFLDMLLSLAMGGAFTRKTAAAAVLAAAVVLAPNHDAMAQTSDEALMRAANALRLAYVRTGDTEVDATAEQGLKGLTFVLGDRTSVRAEEPVGIDIEADELVFYPLLYWPVTPAAREPSAAALAKIDRFMKNGGTIFFDLRDDGQEFGTGGGASDALRTIVAKLNVPPLEPVPQEHVLTKSFYLLSSFPGRYDTGKLWVERSDASSTSSVDGVSSIIIGSNDYAAAWAMDDAQQPLYSVIPPDERQREMAFRTGVNIVMYVLTGNYKSDQVHVPALLERLGQ